MARKDDDAEARRKRAERLRAQIESLEKKPAKKPARKADKAADDSDATGTPGGETPGQSGAPDFRSFVHRRMHELGDDESKKKKD